MRPNLHGFPRILTFGVRLSAAFAVLVLIIFGGSIFLMRQSSHITEIARLTEMLHEHPFAVSNAALEIRARLHATLRTLEMGLRKEADRTAIEDAAEHVMADRDVINRNLSLIGERYLGPQAEVEEARRAFQSLDTQFATLLSLARSGEQEQGLTLLNGLQTTAFSDLVGVLDGIIAFARNRAGAILEESAAARNIATWRLAGFVATGVLLAAIAVGVIATRSVTRPILALQNAMVKIADGDYGAIVPHLGRKDEIGDMARTVEIFRKNGIAKIEAERVKVDFLANMSHELRTPLNAILGFSEIMLAEMFGKLDSPRYRQYLTDIHQSARHLLDIITDILDLTRIQRGRLMLEYEHFDPAELVLEAIRMVELDAMSCGVTVSCNAAKGQIEYVGDRNRLRQIITNLLSNAIKFTLPGGSVTVDIHADADRGLAIRISDTGIGMTAEDVSVALSPFGQLNRRASIRGLGGVGLGLPLAVALTDAHGGRLRIASELQVGTTVTVDLPGPDALAAGLLAPSEGA
ncbi:MAG: hypothetical protein Kow00104_17790 [Rhodothalassiaceae bacterium]